MIASASYSTIQTKRFTGCFGCQDRPAFLQPGNGHLDVVKIFKVAFNEFTREIDLGLSPAFCQFREAAFSSGIEGNGKHINPVYYHLNYCTKQRNVQCETIVPCAASFNKSGYSSIWLSQQKCLKVVNPMKILIIGSGGREHALAWRIKQSPLVTQVFCARGNGGIGQDVTNVALASHADIIAFCKKEKIDFVVIGPEQPLVEGLADTLNANGIAVFGPSAKAAQLEGSKGFTKDLCEKYHIPTAAYGRFTDAEKAKAYIRKHGAPIVVKADGLAAGKGVVVAMNEAEALAAIDEMLGGRFGQAGASVVVEEFMEGEEVSFFALTDGVQAIEFGSAQDHKRVGDNDTGPNTGGMGTFAPAPVMTEALRRQVMETIILPTVKAMQAEGIPYKGVLFAGLMLTKDGPKLLEYNARFGDPETQVLMMRLESDLVPALLACAKGGLDKIDIRFRKEAAVCVVMAANGYPGAYGKGSEIKGLEKLTTRKDIKVFHAGTELKDGKILANGGRVLGVTALGSTLKEAQKRAYEAVDAIDWPDGFCRRDIGSKIVVKEV